MKMPDEVSHAPSWTPRSRQPVTHASSSAGSPASSWNYVIKCMFGRTATVTYSSSGFYDVVLRWSAEQTGTQSSSQPPPVTIAYNWYESQYTPENRARWLVSRDHGTGAYSHPDFIDVVATVRARLNSAYPFLKDLPTDQQASMNGEIADVLVGLIDKHILGFSTSAS